MTMSNERAYSTPVRLVQYALAVLLTFLHFYSLITVFILSASSSSVAPVAAQVGPPTNATNLPTGTCRSDVPCANVRRKFCPEHADVLIAHASRVRAAMACQASAASATHSARRYRKAEIVPLTAMRLPNVDLVQHPEMRNVP